MSEGAPKSVAKTGEEPTKIIEIGGKKFEVGPEDLVYKSWNDMNEKVAELNKALKQGENEWRILTREEYKELEKLVHAIWDEKILSVKEKRLKFDEFVTKLGFTPGERYWSSSEREDVRSRAYGWDADSGNVDSYNKDYKLSVQCIREV